MVFWVDGVNLSSQHLEAEAGGLLCVLSAFEADLDYIVQGQLKLHTEICHKRKNLVLI